MSEITVTGNQLRDSIKRWSLKLDIAIKQFTEGLWVFDEHEGPTLLELSNQIKTAEASIASLQTAQSVYNLAVEVDVQGRTTSLCEIVKRVGGAGRLSKLWRNIAASTGRDRWSRVSLTRSKDDDRAKRSISVQAAVEQADQAEKFAAALRHGLAVGNTVEVSLSIDQDLLR